MNTPDGGPAFPTSQHVYLPDGPITAAPVTSGGLSLRDYFAAAALSALPDRDIHEALMSGKTAELSIPFMARLSYQIADAMLAERAKGGAK